MLWRAVAESNQKFELICPAGYVMLLGMISSSRFPKPGTHQGRSSLLRGGEAVSRDHKIMKRCIPMIRQSIDLHMVVHATSLSD